MIETGITESNADLWNAVDVPIRAEELIPEIGENPAARNVSHRDLGKSREPGGLEGLVISDDFDDPDPELVRLFEEEESV